MITASPLAWPTGWPRTARPRSSQFQVSQHEAQQGVVRELGLLGARDVVVSTNVELRRDGLPYTSRRPPEDQGVAVYFTLNGDQQCIPCDKWKTIRENMRAIELTIAALRGLDRWGAKEMVTAAFSGFKALPAGGEHPRIRAWFEVLGVSPSATTDEIKDAYRTLAQAHHPDQGGSQAEFEAVTTAYREGMAA